MQITGLSLQNYRNIELARLTFGSESVFCIGANAQGKTNLLEALGFITALRSFRTTDSKSLIRQGHREALLKFTVEHSTQGTCELLIRLHGSGKEVHVDGNKVTRFGDFIGHFPTVAMSSQDIQLLRGAPALRRRFMDLVLSAVDSEYYNALLQYGQALKSRNQLLKQRNAHAAELHAFESILARCAVVLLRKRSDSMASLGELLSQFYATIAELDEVPVLQYKPELKFADAQEFLALLEAHRERDRILQTTSRGPHRDDFLLALQHREAREYASEGQQRGLVIALRLAQAAWFHRHLHVTPVLLADDILGELDDRRKNAFWKTILPHQQVFATGTRMPQDALRDWECFHVDQGSFSSAQSPHGA